MIPDGHNRPMSTTFFPQVSNWFANARRRLKNVVQDPKCSWSKRLRMYNQFVQGNAELLSIASDDSIWNSDSETEDNDEKKEPEGSASERRETRSESASFPYIHNIPYI